MTRFSNQTNEQQNVNNSTLSRGKVESRLDSIKNRFHREILSDFYDRVDLLLRVKETYLISKHYFMSNIKGNYEDVLKKCMECLCLDEDFSSLFLMLSGKMLADGNQVFMVDQLIDNIIEKLEFLKKIEPIRKMGYSKVFFEHLSLVMKILSTQDFNYFVKYLLNQDPNKSIDFKKYPSLQNTSCMRLVQFELVSPPNEKLFDKKDESFNRISFFASLARNNTESKKIDDKNNEILKVQTLTCRQEAELFGL